MGSEDLKLSGLKIKRKYFKAFKKSLKSYSIRMEHGPIYFTTLKYYDTTIFGSGQNIINFLKYVYSNEWDWNPSDMNKRWSIFRK